MDAYRVAESDADLPRLVDRAAAGEPVIITREGKPVAELRAIGRSTEAQEALQALLAGLKDMPVSAISSVELLRQMYEEDEPA